MIEYLFDALKQIFRGNSQILRIATFYTGTTLHMWSSYRDPWYMMEDFLSEKSEICGGFWWLARLIACFIFDTKLK